MYYRTKEEQARAIGSKIKPILSHFNKASDMLEQCEGKATGEYEKRANQMLMSFAEMNGMTACLNALELKYEPVIESRCYSLHIKLVRIEGIIVYNDRVDV